MGDTCPQCQHPFRPETKFCGQCGYDLVGRPPVAAAPAAPSGGRDFAKTMLDPSPAGAGAAPKKTPQRTMLGMAAVPIAPPGQAPPAQAPGGTAPTPVGPSVAAAPSAPQPAAPARPKKPMQRTMLGMPMVSAEDAQGTPPAPAAPAAGPAASGASGFAPAPVASAPSPGALLSAQADASPADVPEPAAPAPAARPEKVKPAASNRTMLGVAMAPPAGAPKAKPAAKSNRTMLGMPAGMGAAGGTGAAAPSAPDPGVAGDAWEDDDVPAGLPRKSGGGKGLTIAIVLLVVVALGGAGFAAWQYFGGGGPELGVTVVHGETGEMLQIDVPGAAEGTRVRFNAREVPLETGRARIPLQANDLRIGDNELHVEVVAPDGSVERADVLLSVQYRVRADLSALEQEQPTLRIVVDAVPGSTVTLNEAAVTLDPSGHGVVDHPLDAGDEAQHFERTFHYRVVPPGGAPAEGDVAVRVPFATLQVERPGRTTVTERGRIEVAGSSHPDATVSLDGAALQLTDEGRFVTHIEVPELGEAQHALIARQPGRAPRQRSFTIRRVADLAAEARSYQVDSSLTYARVAANPDTYRGQRAAFVGRIYNVDVHDGKSDLQIVLRECPGAGRCPLWVAFDGATDASLNDWVRVVGEIGGRQQFRAPSGEVMSVPRLDAVFVVPVEE